MNLRLCLLLLLLYIVTMTGVGFVSYQYGRSSKAADVSVDIATEQNRCIAASHQQITNTLQKIRQHTADANTASSALSKIIATQKLNDQKTTKEIRDALSTTAHLRVDCVFNDDIMQRLAAARDRANAAATSGIVDTVRHDTSVKH